MLCSRMNLTERRIRVPRPPVEGPIIRPCSTRKLTIDNDNNSSPATAAATAATALTSTDDATSSPAAAASAPQTASSSAKSTRNSIDIQKTPLIIINLNMPSEAKTLVPMKDINKTPKKLPPFCVQYQNALCNNNNDLSRINHTQFPQFFIRGFEITDQKNGNERKSPRDNDIQQSSDNEQMDNSSNISLEFNNQLTNNHNHINANGNANLYQNMNTDYIFNLVDGYEMDSYGHLPGASRVMTPIPPGYRPLCMRTPSPNTRQIIRVDVTVNREKPTPDEPEKTPSEYNYGVGLDVGMTKHRFGGRRGRFRFNNTTSYI